MRKPACAGYCVATFVRKRTKVHVVGSESCSINEEEKRKVREGEERRSKGRLENNASSDLGC